MNYCSINKLETTAVSLDLEKAFNQCGVGLVCAPLADSLCEMGWPTLGILVCALAARGCPQAHRVGWGAQVREQL